MLGIIVGVVFCIVCFLLIVIILLQAGGAAGFPEPSAGRADTVPSVPRRAGPIFTWVTVALTGIFLLLSVISNFVLVPEQYTSAPAATATRPATTTPRQTGAKPPLKISTKTIPTTQPKK